MVVYCYGDDLLGFFLSYHVFIQTGLDLMRCRNVLDIEYRFGTFRLLFLLEFLLVGNTAVSLKIRQIHKTDVGIVQHSLIIELAHSLHGLVHAIIADADMVGQLEHSAGFALRSAADKADIFVFAAVLFVL